MAQQTPDHLASGTAPEERRVLAGAARAQTTGAGAGPAPSDLPTVAGGAGARPLGSARHRAASRPVALVMGDVDVVRALGLAGIPTAFFGFRDAPARFSRHVGSTLPWIDPERRPVDVVEALIAFAGTQPERPVLLAQTDEAVLLTARHRVALGEAFRLPPCDPDLVERLVDKELFHALATACDLPVPPVRRLRPALGEPPPVLDLRFPLVIKPVVRRSGWESIAAGTKAFHAEGPDDLAVMWPRLAAASSVILAQEAIPGPESNIESFHAYVDDSGEFAATFTGRKIRTLPVRYGHSTAVQVTPLPDVDELGREVFVRIGLRGVAKADFKRDADGRLHLLEINPRFNLWHHPAALAGVNIPALVYADLTGTPRPPVAHRPADVAWCKPLRDVRAAHAVGITPMEWLRWARSCGAVSGLSRDDPMPFFRGAVVSSVRHRASRLLGAPFRH